MMKLLKKLVGMLDPPSPKDLGWSESGALGMRSITPFQPGKTWEDWHKYVRKHYPVRSALMGTKAYLVRKWKRLGDVVYWIKCHTLPSYRFHLLDLRDVDPIRPYTYGYISPGDAIELAAWVCLKRYVERARDPADWATPEQLEDDVKQQKADFDEAEALYIYWTKERKELRDRTMSLFHKMEAESKEALKTTKEPTEEYNLARQSWLESHDLEAQRAEEMLLRLVKIRPTLRLP